ncbi:hypothetical protein A2763_04220 [Candidatus Kaiserbacteria bacterium RIFCSPHIGHO2_01_FULL_54_36]|uniref:Leucine--tRNA ligase n=1 Tax=Candidatus Kaiserbacteria bacterium RIFCSPHIGHO2_01_FULL_54_36 TaxID=1798482 RepID=A0A1F6CPG5_9BACT|nr:MAG: hypothetical protein A2763_04220 [Candidatus Kaiserbacteria bacterium RIFCSPHIGHO2_01_FULL_54_36]
MKSYDHKSIEKKWRNKWEKDGLYKTPDSAKGRENFYLLTEFPYPSGNLHVGHWYAFALPDIRARFESMRGKNVLFPIGFDAFGLPAENAAIKNKVNPRNWTESNIEYMKGQIKSMGTSFDWSREVQTIDPDYYRWTQWMFLQFFKNNLAYRKDTPVNWCPKDKTVLANEQVVDGKCERCDTEVVQKQMLQWNLKITNYADRLIDDLEPLDWPKEIKDSQRNWIGRSEGAEIDFPLVGNVKDDSRFLLLHGRESTSAGEYQPWLKAELEKRGYEVEVVDLPNPNEPNDKEQADYVEKHCKLDERTVVVGHSFGGVVALRLLERGHKVRRVVLVSTPYSGRFLDKKVRKSVTAALKKRFDFETIKKNAKTFMVVPDAKDPVVPASDGEALRKELGAMYMPGKANSSHFTADIEQDVLMMCAPTIRVFTTRADTLYGGTYLVLAPEHPWVQLALAHKGLLENEDEVVRYIDTSSKKTEIERQAVEKEKTGVKLKGVRAINPATGKEIPIWVADFVIGSYGTGAVFADAHDERDYAFAKKYGIPFKETLEPVATKTTGADALKPNMPLIDRQAAMAIVRHPTEDKYLGVTYKPTSVKGFISGGIEDNEKPEEALKREIREEAGFTNIKNVRQLGSVIHSRFWSVKYNRNTNSHYLPFLVELEDLAREEVSAAEKAEHDMEWMSPTELETFINRDDWRAAWNRLQGRAYAGKGILFDSGEFSGLTSDEAIPKIGAKFGRIVKQYHLRDWIVSRQRYWGVPIPIIHCAKCGMVAVPDKDLPVKLPEVKDYLPEGSGKSPLAKATKWVKVKCPQCKGPAERETDTLDTFVDSSWYFLRYSDPKNKKKFADRKKMDAWMPVDLYSGGAEHTTMHVLYSRFWQKALFDLGLVKDSEPYKRRMNRSLILGPDGQKMSKSRGNVVDPDEVVARLGADTVRMYLAFIGPYNEVSSFPWNPDGVAGIRRFLERVVRLSECVVNEEVPENESILHKTIKKVGDDIQALKFNTAISQLMISVNHIEKRGKIAESQWDVFLRLLAPFAPFVSEELWYDAGHKTSLYSAEWPAYDAERLVDEKVTIAVQINGKTRGTALIDVGIDSIAQEAEAQKSVQDRLIGKKIARTVVVPGRLVNFVLEE